MTNKGNDEWFESEQSGGDQFVNIDDISTENTTTFNNSPTGVRQNNNANQEALFPGLQSNMAVGLAKSMLDNAGIPTKVPGWFSFSFLRPYFENVTERLVLERSLSTVYKPLAPMTSIITAPDLYGPAIYVFLLSIMLVLAMKVSHTTVGDGSLMGTSLFSCLFYWFGASAVLYLTSKFFGSDISLVATLSAVGYEYAPLNVIAAWSLFYSEFHWTANLVFYLLFFALTGLSAASLARTMASKAPNKQSGFVLMCMAAGMQVLFALYIRFAFISLFRAISSSPVVDLKEDLINN